MQECYSVAVTPRFREVTYCWSLHKVLRKVSEHVLWSEQTRSHKTAIFRTVNLCHLPESYLLFGKKIYCLHLQGLI